ncbi:MAG: 2-C-methyl-D-erythritol 4-phosphate cytidylyltransferase [Chloroflexi bacterium]|nr:2-C-methyl-D-erythritol 4-phosphate cytidylyltransferase [Chloroflexota bacterium]
MPVALAILAAGAARRAGTDKILGDLGGSPVLAWSLAAARASGVFDDVVVVAPAARLALIAQAARGARVVAGGDTRTASSWAALDATPDADILVIHDAARPFVPPSLFARVVETARAEGTAIAGLQVQDTLRRANEIGESVEEMSRERVWSIQTPQAFKRELLLRARAEVGERVFSDDAAALVAAGIGVKMVPGDRRNMKLTTIEDLSYARELVRTGSVAIPAASA